MSDDPQETIRLRREVTILNETLHKKNLALDALHYVWCDGGCAGGVHRYSDEALTGEVVRQAEKQARRLRRWWTNRCWKSGVPCAECDHAPMPDHAYWPERIKAPLVQPPPGDDPDKRPWGWCWCGCPKYEAPTT